MNKSITNNNILYLLIGGFSLFLFLEAAYFLGLIAKDFLIVSTQNSLLIYLVNEGVQILSFTLFVVFGLRFLARREFSTKQLKATTFIIIILCVVVQVLQILYRANGGFSEDNFNNLENYMIYLGEHYMLYMISSFMSYAQYIIFALILFNYIREDD